MEEKKTRKIMTETDYEKVITDKLIFGKTAEKIASEIGIGVTSVFNLLGVFAAVKDNNWPRCVELIEKGMTVNMFEWSAKKLMIDLPPEVKAASDRRYNKKQEEAKTPVAAQKPDNTALYLGRLIEELAKLNENMTQLMDTVIPKYAEDQRSATMKVASVLCAKIQPVADNIDAIKRELTK